MLIRGHTFLRLLAAGALGLAAECAAAQVSDPAYAPNAWLNIAPGADHTELALSWATLHQDLVGWSVPTLDDVLAAPGSTTSYLLPVPEVQIVKLKKGEDPLSINFATDSRTQIFYGVSLESYSTQAGVTGAAGWYQNKVTVTGLKASSTYAYQVGTGDPSGSGAVDWSSTYNLQTQSPSAFTFIAVGDPQLGASTGGAHEPPAQVGNVLGYDTATWQNSVSVFSGAVPNTAFVISLGDQIDETGSQANADSQYDGYFSPLQLLGIPVATVDGNHDYGLGQYYGYHYNLSNQSTQYGATQYGNDGDYYFKYGNTLFIMLNSNSISAATHDVFIGKALAAHPEVVWKVVCFHHSLFSAASHTFDTDILFRRAAYSAIFDKYGIDVVLSGHDHSFTRSYQMLAGVPQPQSSQTVSNGNVTVTNPTGTLYMTLDSGSGSKFYDLNSAYINSTTGAVTYPVFVANFWQQYLPTFSAVSVTGNSFSIATYAIGSSNVLSQIDGYTIVKQ